MLTVRYKKLCKIYGALYLVVNSWLVLPYSRVFFLIDSRDSMTIRGCLASTCLPLHFSLLMALFVLHALSCFLAVPICVILVQKEAQEAKMVFTSRFRVLKGIAQDAFSMEKQDITCVQRFSI